MRLFLMQRWSAVALIFFLTLHMIVVHYPPGHIDFSLVIERLANPVWKVIDILFLFAVVVHGLTGAYAVLIDVEKVSPYKRLFAGIAIALGIFAMIYGTMTILAFSPDAVVAMP